MAPTLFASADMAALIAAYPPPGPTRKTPSLLRTRSRNHLVQSQKVAARFNSLLEAESQPLRLSELSARLNVESSDWLLNSSDDDSPLLHFTRDERFVLPRTRVTQARETLRELCSAAFVESAVCAAEADVTALTLERLLSAEAQTELTRVRSASGREYIVAKAFVQQMEAWLLKAMGTAGDAKLQLTETLPGVPNDVIQDMAREAIESSDGLRGEIEIAGPSVVFVPTQYTSSQVARERSQRTSRVKALLQAVAADGWFVADGLPDSHDICREACDAYRDEHDGGEGLTSVLGPDGMITAAALRQVIDDSVAELQASAETLAESSSSDAVALTADSEVALVHGSRRPDLARILLHEQQHRQRIDQVFIAARQRQSAASAARFADLFNERVAAPLQLYTSGIDGAGSSDTVLRDHLGEFVRDHAARELIPQMVAAAREVGLLPGGERTRGREVERLTAACKDSKTLADVQAAVHRFARRLKFEVPDAEVVARVKQTILQQQMRSMRRTARGSDVLQNLIWVLLAGRIEGVFTSAGRDTSRMIKLYERVGDAATAAALTRWRDGLKAGGSIAETDLEEMRRLADEAIQGSSH